MTMKLFTALAEIIGDFASIAVAGKFIWFIVLPCFILGATIAGCMGIFTLRLM